MSYLHGLNARKKLMRKAVNNWVTAVKVNTLIDSPCE